MANDTLRTRILLRNDDLSNWLTSELVLAKGEVAIANLSGGTLAEVRVGDGTHTWTNSLKLNVDLNQVSGLQKYRLVRDIIGGDDSEISANPAPYKFRLQAGDLDANVADPLSSENWTTIGTPIDIEPQLASLRGELSNTIVATYLSTSTFNDFSDTVAATYLSVDAFNTWKNEVGLSNATSSNKVATMNDIAGLVGAMHFIGPYDSLEAVGEATNGDVVIIPSTSKEYVYYDPDPTDEETSQTSVDNWIELGDESIYATKNELTAAIQGLSDKVSTEISCLSDIVVTNRTNIETINNTIIPGLSDTIAQTYLSASEITNYYDKTETSSAAEISAQLTSLSDFISDVSTSLTGNYYQKTETSSDSELTQAFSDVYQAIEDTEVGLGATKIVRADGSIEYYNVVNEELNASMIDNPSSVVEVYVGEAVTGIDGGFFTDMTQLEKVVIPASVPGSEIGSQEFSNSLETIIFKDRTQQEADNIAADFVNASGKVTVWHDASQEWVTEQLNGLGTDYIKHGEVTQDELSGYFVLDCGGAELRTGEPTAV